jgi:thioesterase domain-containing protein/acyl carrier protein
LLTIAGVREAAVACHDPGNGDKELVAYWAGDDTIDPSLMRSALAFDLPEVMVPNNFVRLEHLPLTTRGKLDRRALPPPASSRDLRGGASLRQAPAAPASDTERKMIAIWQEVLNISDIGVDDDFFGLGGHSLKALKLTSLIQQRLGVTMPFSTVFAARTVRALAQRSLDCARYGEQALDQPLVTLSFAEGRVPLFAFPPGTGDALGYSELARRLTFCTFHAFNFIDAETRLQEYADLIMSTDPDGPYLLFGYSAGGNMAFRVTKELERRGRSVTAIVMIDSGRVLEKFRFPVKEATRLADEFLEADGVKKYVQSAVLRDKATRTIHKYLETLSQTKDDGVIDAEIHLVLSEGSEDTFTDDRGIMISGKSGWADVTRRGLTSYQARGLHAHLLNKPNLDPNAALLDDIIRGLANARAPAARHGWGGQ